MTLLASERGKNGTVLFGCFLRFDIRFPFVSVFERYRNLVGSVENRLAVCPLIPVPPPAAAGKPWERMRARVTVTVPCFQGLMHQSQPFSEVTHISAFCPV